MIVLLLGVPATAQALQLYTDSSGTADDIHSTLEEERFQGFGTINGIAIVTIFYSERCSDGKLRHRLISARRLDSLEKKAYENYLQAYR